MAMLQYFAQYLLLIIIIHNLMCVINIILVQFTKALALFDILSS